MPFLIAGLIVAFLAMMLFGGSDLDRALIILFNSVETPRLDSAATIIAWFAQPIVLITLGLIGAILPALQKRWRDALCLAVLPLTGWLLILAVGLLASGIKAPVPLPGAAGPGHYPDSGVTLATITIFGLAYVATRTFPARLWALLGAASFALLVGAASLLLIASWPSSVVGGWALGFAWTLLLLRLSGIDLGDGAVTPKPSPTISVPPSASRAPEHQHHIVRRHPGDPGQP